MWRSFRKGFGFFILSVPILAMLIALGASEGIVSVVALLGALVVSLCIAILGTWLIDS